MKKKNIKLTESDLKKIVLKLLDEQFDYDYYDIILDLYNEVGLEGMTDDEIKYLKSGGQSNIPDRFWVVTLILKMKKILTLKKLDLTSLKRLWNPTDIKLLIPLRIVN